MSENNENITTEERVELRPERNSLVIFGKDVSKIPCFRNSILYGMYGGMGYGLGHFLFTSRVTAACNFAVYTFCGVTTIYWIQCRYRYSKTKLEMQRMQKLLRERALWEGTSEDAEKDPD